MKPLCVECKKEYQAKKYGVKVQVAEGKILRGDLFECPGCGHQLLANFGSPMSYRLAKKTEPDIIMDLSR